MKKLLELEEKLIKAKAELEKSMPDNGNGSLESEGGSVIKAEELEDGKKDEKKIEEKIDEHNEKEHGEAKDEDSAMEKEDKLQAKEDKSMISNVAGAVKDGIKDWKSKGKIHDRKYKSGEKQVAQGRKHTGTTGETVKFQKNGQWSV